MPMRLKNVFILAAPFVLAALGSFLGAIGAAGLIEERSQAAINFELRSQGLDWAEATSSGLQVYLSGEAPSEATRFRAITVAGSIVDAERVIDLLSVKAAETIAPPKFSIEVLRNDDGIQLIGLIPVATDREAVVASIEEVTGAQVTDLLEAADYPVPDRWNAALSYGLEAIGSLPRSKISITPTKVVVTASTDSDEERARIERNLRRATPDGLDLAMNITSPRPVITPFTLRFTKDDAGARFDACSADTTTTASRILAAGNSAGAAANSGCTLGLGSPSPNWGRAAEAGIGAIAELGGGSFTMSDTDLSLVALANTAPELYDRVVGDLESNLPDVFSLTAVLPDPVTIDGTGEGAGPPEFIATLSPEGLVQLRGRIPEDSTKEAVLSFARARFGEENLYFGTRTDPELPLGWPIRVLAGLEALTMLNNGSIVVQEDYVEVRGVTGRKNANSDIARILSEKLGEGANFEISVTYEEKLDPAAALPTAEECVADVQAVQAANKITFEPGSATINADARETVELIADILKQCLDVKIEVGGHTDSQGREEMNATLSKQRAQAVIDALAARRVLTSNLRAEGYGESRPIADNDTEEGREANRRIEFRLQAEVDQEQALEAAQAEETTETNGNE